jgi:nicotinamidase-related amidase
MTQDECLLVIVDMQEKLCASMHESRTLIHNTARLLKGASLLGLPLICTEHVPEKMGRTVPELRTLFDEEPICKSGFSCREEPRFESAIRASGKQRILLAGIEAHICIYLTAMDLRASGYSVEVIEDCVSSRKPENKATALERLKMESVFGTCLETVLFSLMRNTGHPAFRDVVKAVKVLSKVL